MTLAPHQRRGVMLNHEGQILTLAGNGDPATAADYARCVVDGAMNAIIRMEGAEVASVFAFGVADRVAGGIRQPTAVFPAPVAIALPEVEETPVQDDEPEVEAIIVETVTGSFRDIPTWFYGFAVIIAMCIGFIAGQGWPR